MRDRTKVGGRKKDRGERQSQGKKDRHRREERKDRGERQSQGRRKKGKTEVRDRAKVGGRKERQR